VKTRSVESAPASLADLAADFQEAVVAQLEDRLSLVEDRHPFSLLTFPAACRPIPSSGRGFSAWGKARGVEVLLASKALTGDNAVMVAFAGLVRFRSGKPGEGLSAPARSRWPLESLE